MNKEIIFKTVAGFGIFAGGVILGKQLEKKSHAKKTVYAGELNVAKKDGSYDIYMSLNVPMEDLETSADVIFRINRIK